MKVDIKKIFLSLPIIILAVLLVAIMVNGATSLFAPSAPITDPGTMKTLEDIYQRIILGTAATPHTLDPISGPAGTMHTLTDIYNAIPENSEVCSGVNAGTAVCAPTDWSDVIGGSSDWATAKAYCENPVNGYLRLPTAGELAKAMTQQLLGTGPQGFVFDNYYFSNTGIVPARVTSTAFNIVLFETTAFARCVR